MKLAVGLGLMVVWAVGQFLFLPWWLERKRADRRCSQCGRSFMYQPSCGPTLAIRRAEILAKRENRKRGEP